MCPAIHKDHEDNVLNHEIFSEDPKELRETSAKVHKIIDNLEKTVLYLITFSRAPLPIQVLHTHIEIVVVVVNMILASLHRILDHYSLSRRTSYGKISWSLETARFIFRLFQSLWHLADTSASDLLLSEVVFISNAEYLNFFVWNALEPLPTVGRGVTGVRQGFEFIKQWKY